MTEHDEAETAHERAGQLISERRFREAVEPAAEACRLRPDWADPRWNYGVLALFDDVDGSIEDWTESVVILCAKCSLGEPHQQEEAQPEPAWRPKRRLGLALRNDSELGRLRRLNLWWRRGIHDVTRVL